MKRLLLSLSFIINIICINAQISRYNYDTNVNFLESQIISQSPNVAEMTRYVDRPVSYFNGTAQISIPLCEVTADDITLPISLSYNSTGFRPMQEASWVGLGWHLSLNSCISRTIKCDDDFVEYQKMKKGTMPITYGYYGSAGLTDNQKLGYFGIPGYSPTSYYQDLLFDSEPDIFSFSLWNGGDKFILSNSDTSSTKALFVDKAAGYKLQIETCNDSTTNRNIHYFNLISSNGTIYEFRKRELTYIIPLPDTNPTNSNVLLNHYDAYSHDQYASSWFLTKITTPLKKTIHFDYEDEDYDAVSQETCVKYNMVGLVDNNEPAEYMSGYEAIINSCAPNVALYTHSKTKIKTARLKQIRWDCGKIVFTASSREDLYSGYYGQKKPKKLDKIEVYNSLDSLVRSYSFDYAYFGANLAESASEDCMYKRLKLMRVSDDLTPNYAYAFEYNENMAFPSKRTKSLDYWGYFNNRNYGSQYYCQVFDAQTGRMYDGAVKDSEFEASSLGVLTKIKHPTGAAETFEYEPNHFSWSRFVRTGGQLLSSLRTMTSYNYGSTTTRLDTLTYSTSSSIRLKINGVLRVADDANYLTDVPIFRITNTSTGVSRDIKSPYFTRSSSQLLNIENSDFVLQPGTYRIQSLVPSYTGEAIWNVDVYETAPVSYNLVTEEKEGAGLRIKRIACAGKTRAFNYSLGTLLVDPVLYHKKCIIGLVSRPVYDPNGIEYSQNDLDGRKVLVQFSESSVPLSTLAKGYDLGYTEVSETVGDVTATYRYEGIRKEERHSENPYQSTNPVFSNGLLSHNYVSHNGETIYYAHTTYGMTQSQDIPGYDFSRLTGLVPYHDYRFKWHYPSHVETFADGVTSSESYQYNSRLLPIRIVKSEASNTVTKTTDITYSSDSSLPVCELMTEANIVLPIKEAVSVNGSRVLGKVETFKQCGSMFVPDKIYDMSLTAADTEQNGNHHLKTSYDQYNNDGKPVQITKDGIPYVYIWGYEGQYPVAEIVNFTYSRLLSYLSEQSQNYYKSLDLPPHELWNVIDRIKTENPHSSVTKYTYKPSVGIISMTAPNGAKTKYSYDASGRLRQVHRELDGTTELINSYEYNYAGNEE